MATYVLPQVLVFQDFTVSPAVDANPLSAYISGGHAFLTRTTDASEKESGLLGYYDNAVDADYLWPNRPTGSKVDQSYSKVYIENALLQYFTDGISTGSVITKLADYNNRISSASVNFATNGSYARDADLYDRDVKAGDVIRVRATPGGLDPVVLWTSVKSVIAEDVAAVVAAATADSANAGASSATQTITKTAGADNCVTLTAGTAYDGLGDGYTSETYTIIVTGSSVGQDYSTATLRILSASGTDDVASVTPAASGSPTNIGTRGLAVTFADDDTAACSLSADNDSVTPNDLIVGQRWNVAVEQAWTAPSPTSNAGTLSTYDSSDTTTYIVEVTRGGLYSGASAPQISVSTTTGSDQSGPTDVSAAAVDVAVGSRNILVQFSGTGLNKGDKYYIGVTGVQSGPMRIIELADNLSSDVSGGDEVGIELYIRNPLLEVSENRIGYAPNKNWEQSETEITLKSGIIAYDSSWTDSGVALPLNVYSCAGCEWGKAYVTYRSWYSNLANQISSISDVGDIDNIAGSLTPDNPLKWGVYKALTNNNGTPVLYSSVTDPDDVDTWDEILDMAQSRDDVYGMCPLTKNYTVLSAFQGHVGSYSSANEGLWRVVWANLTGIPSIPVVSAGSSVPGHTTATTSDGGECLAVVEDDPLTSGTQYTIVRNAAGNGKFSTNGVRAGDIVRLGYTSDGFGNYTYSEYVVDDVQSEEQLRLKAGPSGPVSVAAKIEIWRNLTLTEEAQEIAQDAGAWNDRRVRATWPDQIESSGTIQEGYHLNAALAGLASGILPQQGMTRLAISGFTDVDRTTRFSKSQLDTMALSGTWIVTQSPDGNIFTRHAITTGAYEDINQREEMLTRNVDSISYRFKDYFEPYIGITNVTPSMKQALETGLSSLILLLQRERFTENLGGQLISATVTEFEISPIFKDRYVIRLSVEVPYALNNLEIHLVI